MVYANGTDGGTGKEECAMVVIVQRYNLQSNGGAEKPKIDRLVGKGNIL